MSQHPVLSKGNVAVITGGADGIGFAAAQRFASFGMQVCLLDVNTEKLADASGQIEGAHTIVVDVTQCGDLERARDEVYQRHGKIDVLMNNAGTAMFTRSWEGLENWRRTLEINLWGVINGIHCFIPRMIEQNTPGLVINTGSKQGITAPPGDPAYNVSKAGVKAVTEALQHELRNTERCQLQAHLLVPGLVYTGIFRQFMDEKPDDAWWPEQVIDFMLEKIANGGFYIICPDNDVTEAMDRKRMAWAVGDLIHDRPALSRWHEDYQSAFQSFMERDDDGKTA